METLRYILVAYVLFSPFLWVYWQQKVFVKSLDDDNGNKIIMRLYLISSLACVLFFIISFDPFAVVKAFIEGLRHVNR